MTYDPYSYPQPAPPHREKKERRGAAITALVLGIVAACGSPIPILNNATIIAGVIGVVFAIIALFGRHYVMASFGLFLALLGIAVGISLQIHWGHELDNISNQLNSVGGSSTSAPASTSTTPPVTVTLTANGEPGDTVTYSTSASNLAGTKVTLGPSRSWTYTYSVPAGSDAHGFASVEVDSNSQDSLDDHMSCSIAQNGALHDQQTNALIVLCSSGTLGQ